MSTNVQNLTNLKHSQPGQILVSRHFKLDKPACGRHKARSAGWETADRQDHSGLQVVLAAALPQVQVDPPWDLLELSPTPVVVVEPDP